ncbi:transcription-repair-coupling factor [Clostridium acetireducens DSM 10703]|jgi:transcription-repair coupling factor (superfamily II helicase)|uniref:Transcription-repair-coupling factor n=1 Tax=Clostridium acetireducens DSM 10703 TaxID=1121290 RepID=A0A1E8EZK6_9CLOT|nr:transcription-repair coupling factor [Clostridium acetireducens]OFI06576.1 transcription-repair-coupling factor [Clostridium acetireducens DSM 10703]
MRLDGIVKPLKESTVFKSLLNSINKNVLPAEVSGLSESGRSYLINGLYEEISKSFLILTHSDMEARKLYEDLSLYIQNVYYLPSKDIVFYNIDAVSGDLRWERLKVIREIMKSNKKIIITCIESLAATYIPLNLYKQYTFKLSVGDNLNLEDLSKNLIQSGYQKVNIVEGKGEFSIRGGIVDIYSPISLEPYRLELFDTEIDSIRTFNIESQRSIDKVNSLEIFPAKEIILKEENIKLGIKNIKNDLEIILKNFKNHDNEKAKILEVVNRNIELLQETLTFETIDSYIPYFYENVSSFLEYTKDYFVVIDEFERCLGKLDSVYYEFEENYKNFLKRGNVLPKQVELLFAKDRVLLDLKNTKNIILEPISKSHDVFLPKSLVSFSQTTLNKYNGQLNLLIKDIKDRKDKGYKIIILSGTKTRGERLVNNLRDEGIENIYKDEVLNILPGEVCISFGSQFKGFDFKDIKVCVISDKEVFGDSRKKRKNKKLKKGIAKIKSFTDLKPGDYVVHVNHGIGVYKGIKQLDIEGNKKDYLELFYNSDDKLYVPVEQLDLVQKYIGSEGKTPKINKLGSSEWAKTKSKVKKSIEEIAEDLVKLYAARNTLKGYKFSKDTIWQKQFEDEFPYEETEDQLTAIEDIKKDMESDKIMDRLLCGDVGYGKTEVALRSAFKTVIEGKQVAFLVPTTILAQQHYNNLVKRFSDFPIKVDMISRFKTLKEQKETIKAVKEGNVDILIGTHRIIQKDIEFKDLGLLIIDEEQRFGVSHKEKIKKFKKNVDVLTLTATPIPRTLHMSLVGVRDISVIETPPEERYPIQTYVVEYNDQLIRDAILRELNRNGQVYFVYNRVDKIKEMAAYIAKLLPEGKVCVAHGQMRERELENIMLDFMKNKYNILVSTTIIETGMDIQNVNTMIIYDADKMGLSQLYQLRGRVGRTNRIAYCYLTYKKNKILTEVAEKRLKAIKDFTELGSGFKIALKDLEIRGAGNIMGAAQHGHMATVGYDLYCKMLEDTVKLIKGDIDKEPIETTIELKVDAYVPNYYINDEIQKIEIYKKIAAINSYEDMLDIQEELEDRFSDIPEPINNLINIAYIKSVARNLGIENIKDKKGEIIIQFESKNRLNENVIKSLLDKYRKNILFRFSEKPSIVFKLNTIKKENIIINLKELIEYINKMYTEN